MSRAHAFQLFRSASSSLAARNVALSAPPAARRAVLGARCYSDSKTPSDNAAPAEGAEKAPSTPEEECLQKLKAKETEVTDLTGRLRYLQADFLNLQRNAAREKEQTRDFAITRFASDLLETVDVLDMALKSVPQSALQNASAAASSEPSLAEPPQKTGEQYLSELHTGVEMTHRLLLQTLFRYGVKPFDPTGDKFDPNRHEALFQAPVPDKEPGTVFNCQKTGYMIKDRVLRAAQVGVVQDKS